MLTPVKCGRGLVKLRKTKPRKPKPAVKRKLSQSKLRDWSRTIRGRDKKCMSCGSKESLHAHHIISKYYRPELAYNLSNGVTLCKNCHVGAGGVHDKFNPPKNKKIAYLRQVYLANRPRKKKRKYKRYKAK